MTCRFAAQQCRVQSAQRIFHTTFLTFSGHHNCSRGRVTESHGTGLYVETAHTTPWHQDSDQNEDGMISTRAGSRTTTSAHSTSAVPGFGRFPQRTSFTCTPHPLGFRHPLFLHAFFPSPPVMYTPQTNRATQEGPYWDGETRSHQSCHFCHHADTHWSCQQYYGMEE